MKAVKICGLTRRQDIEAVNRAKPEYAGFVFAKGKRQVDPENDRILAQELDPDIQKVGVFVNESVETILRIVEEWTLDVVQLHGAETSIYSQQFPVSVWKAFAVQSRQDVLKTQEYNVQGFLMDAVTRGILGGTGQCFDWTLLEGLQDLEARGSVKDRPLWILAGGLTLENVKNACNIPRVDVLDVSSGVETDGWKDPKKILDFIMQVRSCGDA